MKYDLLIDSAGLPIAIALSGANWHDSVLLGPLVGSVAGLKTTPRRRQTTAVTGQAAR